MQIGESVNMAITAIMTNKLRSSLTLLGIIIGVMTIIAMQSLITGLRNSVHEQLNQLGSNVFQVQKYPAIGGRHDRDKYRNRKDLTVEHADAVRRLVTAAALVGAEVWTFGREIRYEDKKTNPNMVIAGATPEFLENNGYTLADGRFITEQDVDFNRRVCILGVEPVNTLFPYEDPVGKDVKIEGERFRVIGVLEELGNFLGGSRDNRLVIPISRFELLYGSERSINITVKAKSAELYETCRDQTIGVLRAARKVPPGEENDFEIWTNDEMMEFFDNMTRVVKIVIIAIASIALVVAGVGIMNIMLVSVTERTREIGIRKSIGAKRRDILWQFLIEAIVLSEIGGVIGIFIGLGIGKLVEMTTPVPADVPLWTVILGLVFCSTVGLIFGVGPATKAARMDPIEALRYE
ncbi:FtsX-like permease family protein [candidate division KSB1 bacterium]|nr:ABC transporter permease [candidate division KSB1 bacterium]RQW06463.1 MAG: FtsX-like permease family protein [candidate division KSB1 bacterium]